MALVLDASMALSWCFEDEFSDLSKRAFSALASERVIVPGIWPVEVANGLTVAERRGRIPAGKVDRFIDDIVALPIEVTAPPTGYVARLTGLCRRYALASYDAAYLELAIRERAAIVTQDGRMREAALAAHVKLFTG